MVSLLLDKYEIVRVIGKGGMGMVYEAREVSSGRRVAVKWMHGQSFAEDDPNLLRFEQEARIAGTLDSPHVTAVFECAREPEKDVVFQVMELLEGEDLRSLLDRVGALEPTVALRIATQACAGLAAAHAAGVVHRDIKPENIFLSRNENGDVIVKLLDFGIAKIRQSKDGVPGMTAPLNSMTSSGEMLGTPLYMAPEQFDGAKHVDARADVYSMGVTLYAMLAGAPPYANLKSFMQILRAIMTQPPPPLSQEAPWVRPAVIGIVEKAMQSDRDARYAHGAELFGALEAVMAGASDIRAEMLVGMTEAEKASGAKGGQAGRSADTVTEKAMATAETVVDAKAPWWRRLLGR
ncbi:MAG: serine/threonine protein kinase [Polyangiaceae bacterium]|nr:serine/threonine protein kinase [Polyangiaceae bacterium]